MIVFFWSLYWTLFRLKLPWACILVNTLVKAGIQSSLLHKDIQKLKKFNNRQIYIIFQYAQKTSADFYLCRGVLLEVAHESLRQNKRSKLGPLFPDYLAPCQCQQGNPSQLKRRGLQLSLWGLRWPLNPAGSSSRWTREPSDWAIQRQTLMCF